MFTCLQPFISRLLCKHACKHAGSYTKQMGGILPLYVCSPIQIPRLDA
jgi:hypothetical protein